MNITYEELTQRLIDNDIGRMAKHIGKEDSVYFCSGLSIAHGKNEKRNNIFYIMCHEESLMPVVQRLFKNIDNIEIKNIGRIQAFGG